MSGFDMAVQMKPVFLVLLLTGFAQSAVAEPWKTTGELGLAITRGNSESETANAKLDFSKEDERWVYNANFAFLRTQGRAADAGGVRSQSVTNANRHALGGKVGYNLTDRMYVFGTARYDKDDFAPYRWQLIASAGIGYHFIKEELTQLSAEVGPGVRRVQPPDVFIVGPPSSTVEADAKSDAVVRAGVNFKHQVTPSTSLANTLLIESGGGNTFVQNDLSVQVSINKSLALKTGLQSRHNSEVADGAKKTDTLLTTNIVVTF